MPILERDPWRLQYFEHVECPDDELIPTDDPSEPCYEYETVEFLREVADHADRDDADWLKQHGKLYELVEH